MRSKSISSFVLFFFNYVLIRKSVLTRQLWFNYELLVNAFLQKKKKPKTRRVIVTPHCSSSAAVAYHRLVPRAETSTVKHAASIRQPYSPDVEDKQRQEGGWEGTHLSPPPPPRPPPPDAVLLPKTYCKCWNSPDVEDLSRSVCTTRLTICFYFLVKMWF